MKPTYNALKKRAARLGYRVEKSRGEPAPNDRGEYKRVDVSGDFVVLGPAFDASLSDIADYLSPD